MATPINTLTGTIPLKLANKITEIVTELWESEEFLHHVTPTTAELLKYWFCEPHTSNRYLNFHKGQKQAILNTIYLHEVLKTNSVLDIYKKCYSELLQDLDLVMLAKEKYNIPKYAIKMATGTGKTWVMNAFFIWQYLNARAEDEKSGRYTKNFLLVAPGVIVYDRLLDSYLGKEQKDGSRDVNTSDIISNAELFLPQMHRQSIKAFLQSSVVKKEEIGKKVTSDGILAISNWHLFMGIEETYTEDNPINDPSGVVSDIFPARPGLASGNALENLDNKYFSGGEVEYLAELDDLLVMNDEAHHIHENKVSGEIQEVEWQKSLNFIAKAKSSFTQIDFSATPYDTTGSGQKRAKHYFPHIVVDFDLGAAIRGGLVKLITIDKRKELSTMELDFRAIRDGDEGKGKVIGLSDGQKLMLQAGLKKLEILEKDFIMIAKNKHPKMLVMCEDTSVVPFVEDYLMSIGLEDQEIMGVHSNKKGELKAGEWEVLKQKLFNVDKLKSPKVIVSVLMLREGFDVNNICVIVPLRASSASILLEQTIGRGLRLMWRGEEYEDIKRENLENVLVKKQAPTNYLDVLSIIEHPAFSDFYDDLIAEGLVGTDDGLPEAGQSKGDMISVGLKENFESYDMYWIEIVQDEAEEIAYPAIDIGRLAPYTYHNLEQLKSWTSKGEVFRSEEMTVKTSFGEYRISVDLFKAQNYNDFLQKLIHQITHALGRVKDKGHFKSLPLMQIYQPILLGVIDRYIREKLFSQSFDPFEDENWRILMLKGANITEHIIKELSRTIFNMQNETLTSQAEVNKVYFSTIASINMREKYALDCQKTIYEKTAYPSNRGGLEKAFLEFLDRDSKVIRFVKILEFKHLFATIAYFRDDGLMAHYYPDFLVETSQYIYIVETKADKDLKNTNVKQKQKATLDFIKRINHLNAETRENKEWVYLLLGETLFYSLVKSGADMDDIGISAKISEATLSGSLFDM